jgi:hypothetical protein
MQIVDGKAQLSGDVSHCGRDVGQDGSVGPIVCDDAKANADVYPDVLAMAPNLFSIPKPTSWAVAETAICRDYTDEGGTIPITSGAYEFRYTIERWDQLPGFPTPEEFQSGLINGLYCS